MKVWPTIEYLIRRRITLDLALTSALPLQSLASSERLRTKAFQPRRVISVVPGLGLCNEVQCMPRALPVRKVEMGMLYVPESTWIWRWWAKAFLDLDKPRSLNLRATHHLTTSGHEDVYNKYEGMHTHPARLCHDSLAAKLLERIIPTAGSIRAIVLEKTDTLPVNVTVTVYVHCTAVLILQ